MKVSLSRRRWRTLRGPACPVRSGGAAGSATSDRREIRRLRAALRAEQRSGAEKERLLAGVSHDVRTPVNAIVGMAHIAQAHLDDRDRMGECLEQILRATDHLLGLIDDVLDMSGLERGALSLRESPCILGDIVERALEMVRPQARAKGQTLSLDLRAVRHRQLLGDAMRIHRILINLLSNAVKYTQAGGAIGLLVEELADGHTGCARLCFTVRDNGMGMSEDTMARMFQPYARAQAAADAAIQGTGLGLTITKALVDAMGGSITASSRIGEGSAFAVTLELRIDSQAGPGQAANVYAGRRFLLAEDNEMSADVMIELLRERGAEVLRAENGRKAVTLMLAHPAGHFDAVLMDVMMPEMNGCQAARAIRALDREDAHAVPIIAMTGAASPEDIRAAQESGMNAHIVKPVDLDELARALERLAR